jgi:hypothetical protein
MNFHLFIRNAGLTERVSHRQSYETVLRKCSMTASHKDVAKCFTHPQREANDNVNSQFHQHMQNPLTREV